MLFDCLTAKLCKSTGILCPYKIATRRCDTDAPNKFTVNGTRSCNIKQNKNKNNNEKFILRWCTGTRDG